MSLAFLVGGELGAVGGYIGTNREGCKLRHVDMRMAHSRRRGFISHQLGTSRPTLRAGHQRFNPSMRIMRPLVLFRHAYMDHRPTRGSPWNFSRTDSTKNICSRSVFDLLFVDFGLFGQPVKPWVLPRASAIWVARFSGVLYSHDGQRGVGTVRFSRHTQRSPVSVQPNPVAQ